MWLIVSVVTALLVATLMVGANTPNVLLAPSTTAKAIISRFSLKMMF
jgi:hypothetical protein